MTSIGTIAKSAAIIAGGLTVGIAAGAGLRPRVDPGLSLPESIGGSAAGLGAGALATLAMRSEGLRFAGVTGTAITASVAAALLAANLGHED